MGGDGGGAVGVSSTWGCGTRTSKRGSAGSKHGPQQAGGRHDQQGGQKPCVTCSLLGPKGVFLHRFSRKRGQLRFLLPVTRGSLAHADANAASRASIVHADGQEQGVRNRLPKGSRSPWPARTLAPSQRGVCRRRVPLGSRAVRASVVK